MAKNKIVETPIENAASSAAADLIATRRGVVLASKQVMFFKSFGTAILGVFLFLLGTFGSAYVFRNSGGFTIEIAGGSKSTRAIALATDPSFTDASVNISFSETTPMTNISGSWISDEVDNVDGEHHGKDYLAYTFYVKNVGTESVNLYGKLSILTQAKGADEALWVRIYQNGEKHTYAKLASDGSPEVGTIPFHSDGTVYDGTFEDLEPGQYVKYTIVLWLEGDDPECLESIRGGLVRLEMIFTI